MSRVKVYRYHKASGVLHLKNSSGAVQRFNNMASRGTASFAGGLLVGGFVAWHAASPSVPTAPHIIHSPAFHVPSSAAPKLPSSSAAAPRKKRPLAQRTVQQAIQDARTLGPFYGDIAAPGEFRRMVNTVSVGGEIVLLHGDFHRLRMLVNLIANLNEHDIYHILLLGFNQATCTQLARRRLIGCAHSSYLWDESADGEAGQLARRRSRWTLAPKYVAWIQKFHYMRLLIEAKINILALDSDVVATSSPYPHLHGPFRSFHMVTAFDTKGGFANINVGVVYTQNASVGGAVHTLFVEFERRVALGLRLRPPQREGRREGLAVRLFWDQNLFNKVLLSSLIGRDVYLPDDSDVAWTRAHADSLRAAGRPEHWLSGEGDGTGGPGEERRPRFDAGRPPADAHLRVATPQGLTVRTPWYPPIAEYKWTPLPAPTWRELSAPEGARALPGYGLGTRERRALPPPERILLAPPWLISADNALGHRYKGWMYGARPPPCVLLHFVCVAAGERSRILPMQLFGRWYQKQVEAEVRELVAANLTDGTQASSTDDGERGGIGGDGSAIVVRPPAEVPGSRRRVLALEGAIIDNAMTPRPWPQLNRLHALLGGLAVLTGRALALPAINCTRTVEVGNPFFQPGTLPNRCFWHVHHGAGGVSCVFRLGACGEAMDIVSPTELQAALNRAKPRSVPTVTIDLFSSTAKTLQAELTQLEHTHAETEVVLVRVTPPATLATPEPPPTSRRRRRVAPSADDLQLTSQYPRYARAVDKFVRTCPELVDRSKQHKRECTNVC